MYLKPGNLIKDLVVEQKSVTTEHGRPRSVFDAEHTEHIKGVLSSASPTEKERWAQLQHPITHELVQRGEPKAKPEDRMIMGGRTFYVQGVDHIADIGVATIYYLEERSDTGE